MVDKLFENSTFPVALSARDKKKNANGKAKFFRISFELKPITAEHFQVFKGKGYSFNELVQPKVVVKALKYHSALTGDFDSYVLCRQTAEGLAERFNGLFSGFGIKIRFVFSSCTTIHERATLSMFYKKFRKEETVLVEEKIRGKFVQFVSNIGVSSHNDMNTMVLAAFSHFTYHESGGALVVCDFKGVKLTNSFEFTLTNPTIHSTTGRFGAKDKRDAGIHDCRNNHACNNFCGIFLADSKTNANITGSDEVRP